IWSLGGDNNDPNINATFLQPFLNYTTKTHTTFGLDMEDTYDWVADQWTVPFNLTVSQILKIGKQPISIQFGGRYYAEAPSGGPDWGLRLNFTLLFPTPKPKAGACPGTHDKKVKPPPTIGMGWTRSKSNIQSPPNQTTSKRNKIL